MGSSLQKAGTKFGAFSESCSSMEHRKGSLTIIPSSTEQCSIRATEEVNSGSVGGRAAKQKGEKVLTAPGWFFQETGFLQRQ